MGKRDAPWNKKDKPSESSQEDASPSKKQRKSTLRSPARPEAAARAPSSSHKPQKRTSDSSTEATRRASATQRPGKAEETVAEETVERAKELTAEEEALEAEKRSILASIDSHAANKQTKKAKALLQQAVNAALEAEACSTDGKTTTKKKKKKKKKHTPCKEGRECIVNSCRFSHCGDRCPRGSSCTRGASCLFYHAKLDKEALATIEQREQEEAARVAADEDEEEGGGEKNSVGVHTEDAETGDDRVDVDGLGHGGKRKVAPVYRDLSKRQAHVALTGEAPDIMALACTFGPVKKLSATRGLYQLCRLGDKVKFNCTHTGKPYLSSVLAFNVATGAVYSNAAFGLLVPAKVKGPAAPAKKDKVAAFAPAAPAAAASIRAMPVKTESKKRAADKARGTTEAAAAAVMKKQKRQQQQKEKRKQAQEQQWQ